MKEMGYSNRLIAWLIYRDRSEKAQKKVRAILSYIKKKALESGSKQAEDNSLGDFVSELRKRKNLSVSTLISRGFSIRAIAILLYGNDNEYNQSRVRAHVSKLRKNLRSGYAFQVQNLRSRVGVVNSPNKTCDFGSQPQPQPKPEHKISSSCDGGEQSKI
jgi:hypothetical protein